MKSRTLKPLSPMPYDDDLNSRSSFISSKILTVSSFQEVTEKVYLELKECRYAIF